MYSGCASIFGPLGNGEGDGAAEVAGDACPGDAGAGEVEALGEGDTANVAVNAMIARSGTDASIRTGATRRT
jgi:hypothetical protein